VSVARCEPSVTNAPPAGGWDWDALARTAAANSSEARALLLEAQAERHQTAVDTGWRDPQFRVGRHWGDQDSSTPGRTGMRTYPEEVNSPRRAFTRYRERENQSFDGNTLGLRVYTANPFVNRWLRKRGEASAHALEGKSDEEAYAVYCEVRTLCLEAELLREELDLLEQMVQSRTELRDVRHEQVDAGVTTPLDLLRAETRLAALRSEISGKRMARQQLLRRISLLSGVPAEQLTLRPRPAAQPIAAAYLDPAVLTDLAFARRPDLARLEREKEAAEYAVKAARAGQIPWFEYIEGTYEDEKSEQNSYEAHISGHDHTTGKEAEWQVRMAVTVPVFTWLGDEIKLARTQLAAAEARVRGQYDMIRAEISGVLDDYHAASAESQRLTEERERLRKTMTEKIDTLAQESAVKREDVLETREELLAYQRVCLKAERESLFMAQCLETVSGGSLGELR
jgi:outer membrane protein TolC